MHIYIREGMVQAVQELLEGDPTTPSHFKMEKDKESGEFYIQIFGDPFSPTFAMRMLPNDMVDRYSSMSYVDNPACFRTEGYYVEGNAQICCHLFSFEEGRQLKQRMFIDMTAPTLEELQRAYFLFRAGRINPFENWEAPQTKSKR